MFHGVGLPLLVAVFLVSGFVAGFFDSVVGGSGVITLPTLLWAGMEPHFALGTNKFAGTAASSISSFNYIRSGNLYWPLLIVMIPFTFIGALIGADTVLAVNQHYLKLIIFIAIVLIALLTLWKKDMGKVNRFAGMRTRTSVLAAVIALALGFYDGFIGPGTGSFLLFVFLTVFRFDFITAAGNGRVLNFTSNVAALGLFAIRGKVLYLLGLPMAAGMMVGAQIGSQYAVKRGATFIRPLFIGVAIVLSIRMGLDAFTRF
ncbi:MAG: TSUP family transporter [Firmicutes bacterium]|nr:TSUP family transporter [Bacillota bacterium]